MTRYLRAGLAAGVVHALLAMAFVHFVLDETLRDELAAVLAEVTGKAQPAVDAVAASGTDWGQVALHLGIRLLFGFVTMALFAALQRKRMRFRAARLTGLVFWIVGYIAWPLFLAASYGLSVTLLFVSIGYGLVETQVAAHVGALAWGRRER
ncbi:MAG: hypothetical protein AB7O97_22630 [Planctomycetota bacterium]